MTNASRHDGLSDGKLTEIALRLRLRMSQTNLSVTELARRCDTLANDVFDDETRPNLTRERIAKILMNGQSRVGKGAARVVSQAEIVVMSDVLDVAPEWLARQTAGAMPAFWDVSSDPKVGGRVGHLLAHYEEETGETLLWGESLLCSLTPPEFAHGYHESYFAEFETIGLRREKRVLIETYDRIGNLRRHRTFDDLSKRNWTVTQIVFLSELEKMAGGTGHYRGIRIGTRRKCLENLLIFLADDSFGVRLIVARDADAPHVKNFLRECDRFGVNGDKFSLWGYRSGKIAWSEDARLVRRHRVVLEELTKRSAFRERPKVLTLLARLREALERKSE